MNKTYKIGEFAKLTGYSVNSLQRLDREGKFKAKRTVTDKRYYTEEDLELFLTGQITQKEKRVSVGYCRVSSISQKSDLKHQEEELMEDLLLILHVFVILLLIFLLF